MRFREMLLALYPKTVRYKPADPEAVLLLEPMVNSLHHYIALDVVRKADTANQHDGMCRFDYRQAGLPMPPALIPSWIEYSGYTKKNWPEDLPVIMPDFFQLERHHFASVEARNLLDSLAPDAIKFIEIEIKLPRKMVRSKQYFCVNVSDQAQMVDWEQSKRWCKPPYDSTHFFENSRGIIFKRRTASAPSMWREMSLDDTYRSSQSDFLMWGSVWNELTKEFPMQLVRNCVTDPLEH